MSDEAMYRLKIIEFGKRHVPIILQNENGPCPLIAIGNVLLLRGKISIHSDHSFVSVSELIERIADYMFDSNPELKDEVMEQSRLVSLSDAMSMLPDLQYGMDVNPRFRKTNDFEFTKQMVIFDLLNITMRHAWILDPQDENCAAVISDRSYNQLTERLLAYRVAMDEDTADPAGVGSEADEITQYVACIVSECIARVAAENQAALAEPSQESSPTNDALTRDGMTIESFLNDTALQITYYGIMQLHEEMADGELCVFFRNNHFNTLMKRNNEIFTLVTDVGFLDVPEVIWEKVTEIDGDTVFCDHNFHALTDADHSRLSPKAKGRKSLLAAGGATVAGAGAISAAGMGSSNTSAPSQYSASREDDADYQYALQLQQEEQRLAEQQRSSNQPGQRTAAGQRRDAGQQQHRNPHDRYAAQAAQHRQLHDERMKRNPAPGSVDGVDGSVDGSRKQKKDKCCLQ